jgi:DNA polymerase
MDEQKSIVVNCRKSDYDISIGRPPGSTKEHFGNPFSDNPNSKASVLVKDRGEAIQFFREWILGQKHQNVEPERRKWILEHLGELEGKRLGCYCTPKPCHGDVYVELLEWEELKKFDWDPEKCGKHPMPITRDPLKPVSPQQRMLDALGFMVRCCSLCALGKQLCEEKDITFDPHVFSTNNVSRWMVVGQNPGFMECQEGTPFVGPAGKSFDKELAKHGIGRDAFYISNTCKCHSLGNEKPTPDQVHACEHFLRLEIAILRPRLIITLGQTAFDLFCPDKVMKDYLGSIVESEKFSVMVYPIYHPSPRNLDITERRQRFEGDIETLCELMKRVGRRRDD